jgi:phosphatidylserine/phosphatidylglycerophosphate/cardiolipin synthase-like enzyme
MKLIVLPEAGMGAMLAALRGAKKSVELTIFRFDRADIEAALKAAVSRGVAVSALIAYTNRGGEAGLRKLEMRLLEVGVTVSRTAADLLRYHNKLMIIDRKVLCVMSYNFTHLDIDHSRSFAIITRKARLVQEATRLFEADSTRTPYFASEPSFVVSPVNARKVLGAFILKARTQLLIYDPSIDDRAMLLALEARRKAGVEVRVIGHVGRQNSGLEVRQLGSRRLHTRAIIRDGTQVFLGSQSLSPAELDSRREVGVMVRDRKILSELTRTFEVDWKASVAREGKTDVSKTIKKVSKRISKGMAGELSSLKPIVKEALKEARTEKKGQPILDPQELKDTVKGAVKEAVRERVARAVKKALGPGAQADAGTLLVKSLRKA